MRTRALVLTVGLAIPASAIACMWTTDTVEEELALRGTELFDLITGQFPHHGQAWYEAEVARTQTALKKDGNDDVARNDLAAALTKLGKHAEAKAEFEALLKKDPQKYETLSNLGVLHKKMGEFTKAAD